ncbi:hypothetical protein GN244_ATG03912 [Phytophthora infestans]|uniref:Uncharacterized protein n=1 Tax=Phytophthora infestans TaxID=4787 RepID=A0A833THS4_PHYIN|nr:hypothetical protein GN244_ATG03912 [Phytophthora infestans]
MNSSRVAEIKDKRSPPRLGYNDLLTLPIQVAEPGAGATAKELEQYKLEMAFLIEQESYLRDLFNQTLSHRYMALFEYASYVTGSACRLAAA